jgi:GntR family transcriptional regulator
MNWTVDPSASVPPSRQLVETILDGIAREVLRAGDQLPSVRGLAAEARVNHNTVARAYRDLEVLGVLRGENGRGCFVTDAAPAVARRERGSATLAAFRTALGEALRAGHSLETLEAELRLLVRESA